MKDLGSEKFKQDKLETIAKMEKYLASVGCRRKLVNEKRERERERCVCETCTFSPQNVAVSFHEEGVLVSGWPY